MIALACDHVGVQLKQDVAEYLDACGLEYKDFGTVNEDSCDYPQYAIAASQAVIDGECDRGILICGTGIGMSLAANKVKGIRCVVCSEPYSALMSRNHNDCNMLAIGARVIGKDMALMIVKTWLEAEFMGGRHAERVAQVMDIE